MSYMNYFVFFIFVIVLSFIIVHYCVFSHAAQRERNARERLYRLRKDLYEATAFPDRCCDNAATIKSSNHSAVAAIVSPSAAVIADNTDNDDNKENDNASPTAAALIEFEPLTPLRFTSVREIESALDVTTVASLRHVRSSDVPFSAAKDTIDDDTKANDSKNDEKTLDDNNQEQWQPYVNPITRIESLTIEPSRLRDYILADETSNSNGGDTGLYDDWFRSERSYVAMFSFQHEVLRYVATESNNEIRKIDAYVRAVSILRDFARRFLRIVENVARETSYLTKIKAMQPWARPDNAIDWRLFVTAAAAHFAQCVHFVRDRSVREPAERCVTLLARKPFETIGRSDDEVDDITAYRLCNAWILTRVTHGEYDWWRDANYGKLVRTMRDRMIGDGTLRSVTQQWLYYEPPAIDSVVRLRDHGRLLQGVVPFYGDLWHRYVYTRNLRAWDKRLDAYLSSDTAAASDFAPLRLLVHTQVPYACFGLFGPGASIPSHWVWPQTELGVAVIPSIGLLRMYNQRFSFTSRLIKEHLPFYTYRRGQFNLRLMHITAQQRMFVLLGDRELSDVNVATTTAAAAAYQPGCIILDGEDEQWVLDNCRVRTEGGDLTALYPLRASGTVMGTTSVGLLIQRYEMFRGLLIEEWLMLERNHNRMYLHVTIDNRTNRTATFYTSASNKGTVRRVPPGTRATIYAYADFDDQALHTRLLCNPMQLEAFLNESQEAITYTSFLDNGCIYYALSAEDATRHVYAISRDNMLEMPESLTCRDRTYTFSGAYNQYVHVTDRIRPH